MDLVLRNARLADAPPAPLLDIGIADGLIRTIAPGLQTEAPAVDVGGCLVLPGLVETHLHLDKACIMERCKAEKGDLAEAIAETAKAKRGFTAEDVHERARRTLERCLVQGTTHIRTQLEVDPGIGLKGLEGVLPLVDAYRWAVDLEICVFPQEGLLNRLGTEALMREALRRGCRVVGAAPYTDSDPSAQIERVFEIARDFDADIDMHLDFSLDAESLDLLQVCEATERHRYGGRVAVGHVSKLSALPPDRFEACGRRLADAGVALTVLPATDLYLMGRGASYNVPRGVVPCHRLHAAGVTCSLSSNNILNPFTPYGDGSLVRMANLYANIAQIGTRLGLRACLDMITGDAARLLRLKGYGVAPGCRADLVVLDATEPESVVAELAPVLWAFKAGRCTVSRTPAVLHSPSCRPGLPLASGQ